MKKESAQGQVKVHLELDLDLDLDEAVSTEQYRRGRGGVKGSGKSSHAPPPPLVTTGVERRLGVAISPAPAREPPGIGARGAGGAASPPAPPPITPAHSPHTGMHTTVRWYNADKGGQGRRARGSRYKTYLGTITGGLWAWVGARTSTSTPRTAPASTPRRPALLRLGGGWAHGQPPQGRVVRWANEKPRGGDKGDMRTSLSPTALHTPVQAPQALSLTRALIPDEPR